jgi:hypothetical protein
MAKIKKRLDSKVILPDFIRVPAGENVLQFSAPSDYF